MHQLNSTKRACVTSNAIYLPGSRILHYVRLRYPIFLRKVSRVIFLLVPNISLQEIGERLREFGRKISSELRINLRRAVRQLGLSFLKLEIENTENENTKKGFIAKFSEKRVS
jgi:hypothetical protein